MRNYAKQPLETERAIKPEKLKRHTFFIFFAVVLVWGSLVWGLLALGEATNRTGEAGGVTGAQQGSAELPSLTTSFHDENGLTNEENREVINLAAQVVREIEARGFRVEEVIVPLGYLREFDLVLNREASDGAAAPSIRLRCSTMRLPAATAADAIEVFDRWLDGELPADDYIDLRTPRRAFYR